MDKLKLALLVAVALLLVMQLISRDLQRANLREVNETVGNLSRSLQQQEQSLARIGEMQRSLDRLSTAIEGLTARGVAATPGTGPATGGPGAGPANGTPAAPASAGERDGNPKLGVNFLLPYDGSLWNPAWLKGTFQQFGETPKGLNRMLESSATTSDIHTLISDTLCDTHPAHPQQWSESLAESVVISDDYKTYTFKLRPGVVWQRPAIARQARYAWLDRDVPLTAGDFAFYLELVQNPEVECPHLKSYYEDLEKAEAIDDLTLRITWKRTIYTSLSFSMGIPPMPRHVYTRNADGSDIPPNQVGVRFNQHWFDEERQAIGVGAYLLESFEPDKITRFVRNANYWGKTLHFEAIEWRDDIKQPDPMLIAFKNGQVHAHSLQPNQYKSQILDGNEPRFAKPDPQDPKAGRKGPLAWERVKSNGFFYLGWNMRTDLFADKRVRQAMSHAFPKKRLIDEVYFGLGEAVSTDVHPDNIYCNKDLTPYAFDLERAKALLAEAGWADTDGDGWLDKELRGKRRPLRFTVKYYANSPEWDRVLLIFREQLAKVGVELVAQSFEWKELLRIYQERDFDAMVGGWRLDLDIDYFQLWHSSQADQPDSSNHCGFKNPRVDELADLLRRTFETGERIRIAKEIQAILHEEQPYTFFRSSEGIFVWQNDGPPAPNRYLEGVTHGLDHFHPLFSRTRLAWHFRD